MSKGQEDDESSASAPCDLRRGPWTLEEDNLLINYITCNGEGRWNTLAKCAGLKRTGKSCRLRWLNYLKPDIKRGNLSPQEQLLILELHSKLGNRWSKIAQHLPGRTDNEIKNYWRTRVQKQARQLNVDSNSKKFLEAIRHYWMPRLLEKAEINASTSSTATSSSNISNIDNSSNNNQESAPPLVANEAPPEKAMEMKIDDKQGSSVPEFCEIKNECYQVDMTEVFPNDEELMSLSHDWFKDEVPLPMPEASFWNMDELWHFRKPEVGI